MDVMYLPENLIWRGQRGVSGACEKCRYTRKSQDTPRSKMWLTQGLPPICCGPIKNLLLLDILITPPSSSRSKTQPAPLWEHSFCLEMALQGVQLYWETFSCSICLDLLKDPVTTSCGHSYCMNCIKTHWDGEDLRQINSCPQCRQTFTPRPVLMKNTMLADLVEELKKTGLQAGPADHCYAGPEDVACDVCTGRKLKAFKSCLVCLASYCEQHLQQHYDVAPLKKHKLVEPSKKLQEKEERTERQRELEVSCLNIQQRIQDREKDVKLLQQEVEAVNRSADKAVEDSEKIFTELIHLMERRSCDMKQQVRSQQKSEVSRVTELQEKLEQEITELKRRDAELKLLSHTEDHNQFLLSYSSLSPLSESAHSSSIYIRPLRYFEDVTAAVSEVRDKLQDVLREKWTNISQTVTEVDVLLSHSEPKTRAGFLKYSREISLDPNTAHTVVLLSEGNRRATSVRRQQPYPSHQDRFTDCPQVLSRESLTGRCYWEVKWGGTGVNVAVAYKSIRRAGMSNECLFGFNDKSCALECKQNSYTFWYNIINTPPLRSSVIQTRSVPGSQCRYSVLLQRLWNHDSPPQSPDQIHWASPCWTLASLLRRHCWVLLNELDRSHLRVKFCVLTLKLILSPCLLLRADCCVVSSLLRNQLTIKHYGDSWTSSHELFCKCVSVFKWRSFLCLFHCLFTVYLPELTLHFRLFHCMSLERESTRPSFTICCSHHFVTVIILIIINKEILHCSLSHRWDSGQTNWLCWWSESVHDYWWDVWTSWRFTWWINKQEQSVSSCLHSRVSYKTDGENVKLIWEYTQKTTKHFPFKQLKCL